MGNVRRLLPLLLTVLLIGACGGDDDADPTAEGAPTTASGPESEDEQPEESAASTDEDQALAEAAVLKLSDFEPGWRADEPEPEDEDAPDIEDVCEGFDDSAETGNADSKTFVREDAEIDNTVTVHETEADAEALFEVFKSEETAACLRGYMDDLVREGLAEDPEAAEQIDDLETRLGAVSVDDYGDGATAYQVQVTVSTSGMEFDFYVDAILVRVDRALSMFMFADVFTPLEEPRDAVITAVVDRLTEQFAA